MKEVNYEQGMTKVWSDGEKVIIKNTAGPRWVKDNIEQIFGVGEWEKLYKVKYYEIDDRKNPLTKGRTFEVITGYIPQRVINDLREQDLLPKDVQNKNALDALKDI